MNSLKLITLSSFVSNILNRFCAYNPSGRFTARQNSSQSITPSSLLALLSWLKQRQRSLISSPVKVETLLNSKSSFDLRHLILVFVTPIDIKLQVKIIRLYQMAFQGIKGNNLASITNSNGFNSVVRSEAKMLKAIRQAVLTNQLDEKKSVNLQNIDSQSNGQVHTQSLSNRANTANVFNGLYRGQRRLTDQFKNKSLEKLQALNSYADENPLTTYEGAGTQQSYVNLGETFIERQEATASSWNKQNGYSSQQSRKQVSFVETKPQEDHPLKRNLLGKLQTLKTRAIRIILSEQNDLDSENYMNASNGASTCVSDEELEELIKEIEEQTSFFLTHQQVVTGPASNYGSKLSEIYNSTGQQQPLSHFQPSPYSGGDSYRMNSFMIEQGQEQIKLLQSISNLQQFISHDIKDIKTLRMVLFKLKEDLMRKRKERRERLLRKQIEEPAMVVQPQAKTTMYKKSTEQQYLSEDLNFFVKRRVPQTSSQKHRTTRYDGGSQKRNVKIESRGMSLLKNAMVKQSREKNTLEDGESIELKEIPKVILMKTENQNTLNHSEYNSIAQRRVSDQQSSFRTHTAGYVQSYVQMPRMDNQKIEGALKSFWQKPSHKPQNSLHKSLDIQQPSYEQQIIHKTNSMVSPYVEQGSQERRPNMFQQNNQSQQMRQMPAQIVSQIAKSPNVDKYTANLTRDLRATLEFLHDKNLSATGTVATSPPVQLNQPSLDQFHYTGINFLMKPKKHLPIQPLPHSSKPQATGLSAMILSNANLKALGNAPKSTYNPNSVANLYSQVNFKKQPTSSTSTLLATEHNLRDQLRKANENNRDTSSPFVESHALKPVNLICPQVRFQKNQSNLSQSIGLRREGSTSSINGSTGGEDLQHILDDKGKRRGSNSGPSNATSSGRQQRQSIGIKQK
ncbi:hypothetical protein FGO68_gene997 [Halteria grandinella]|uniref:Uncharacterized protein n=1 Tax=Halteria grandinella TaxID=5974 RepID=A0A8J8NH59_HALGN|nr:hypothetical protein FGO68_gene997 [Halteria grandinella]